MERVSLKRVYWIIGPKSSRADTSSFSARGAMWRAAQERAYLVVLHLQTLCQPKWLRDILCYQHSLQVMIQGNI